jgi:hypothetical protein
MLDGITLERLGGNGILDRAEVERRALLLIGVGLP